MLTDTHLLGQVSQNPLSYTLRRYYVDAFFMHQIKQIPARSLVIDLGGKKTNKRGYFDLEQTSLRVLYLNLTKQDLPDVQAYAEAIPLQSSVADVVISGELLEHVPDPRPVLSEAFRILKPGGLFLATVPFLYRIHADPYDYGRYTDYFWWENLEASGFEQIEIARQGGFWSVMADGLFTYIRVRRERGQSNRGWGRLLQWLRPLAIQWDVRKDNMEHPLMSSYTTGFGIKGIKP